MAKRPGKSRSNDNSVPPENNVSMWSVVEQNRTHNELATRFVNEEQERVRFVTEWRKWLIWDGRRWKVDDGENVVLGLARKFADGLWDQYAIASQSALTRDTINSVRSFCKASNDQRGIKSFLSLARSDQRIAVSFELLNANPHLLNCRNGTLDFETGEFREHSQDDLITQLANVYYHPGEECPQWESALQTIFAQDGEVIRFVKQLLGYSCTGDTGEHILPIAYGSGCNGKSTIWNAILSLIGEYGGLANDTLLLGDKNTHPTEKAFLYQRRFVPISEPEQSATLRESRVKELTGDSTITARRMNEDFWSFTRTHTFWLSTNHLPRIRGSDDGIWRRVKLIPFGVDLREVTTPIPDLDKKLVAEEGPGILNWLLEGYRDYKENGFVEPQATRLATSHYRDDQDELRMFVRDRCEEGAQLIVTSTDLFSEYQKWGGKLTRTAFGLAMAERFEKDEPTSGAYRKKTVYRGIGLMNCEPNF